MTDHNLSNSPPTGEAEQASIAYYCLVDFCPALNGYDSDYHSRLLDLLENGCYTVWKDSFQGNEEYQQRPGWFRVCVGAEVPDDKQHKVVIDIVRGRIIRNRETALLMEENYPEHNRCAVDSPVYRQRNESDNDATVVGTVRRYFANLQGWPVFPDTFWMGHPGGRPDVEDVLITIIEWFVMTFLVFILLSVVGFFYVFICSLFDIS